MNALVEFMRADLTAGEVPHGTGKLVERLESEFGPALKAVLMYGSCRRKRDAGEGLVDLLVVVSGYRAAFGSGLTALFNWLLPPNVYYLQADDGERTLRCKYAVISLAQFQRRTASRSDHYFWARFCQPTRLVAGDHDMLEPLARSRARGAISFAGRIAPLIEQPVDAECFWTLAVQQTYRCELRPEPPDSAARLIAHDLPYWQELTALLADGTIALESGPDGRFRSSRGQLARLRTRLGWLARRPLGKLFNLARLFKAAGTFSNGIDYIVWKVERHSGVRIEPTERMRRHPRLAAWGLAWRMWRQGGFR
jgi:hypothetical protein